MRPRRNQYPARQRGVVLIFSLIILVILMIGAVALMRSMNSSVLSAGNLAIHRDLINQGEQAVSNVITEFKTGAAPLSGAYTATNVNANYSAIALVTNPQGVPTALLGNNATFAAVGLVANDITGATPDVGIRYVIDRLCNTAGIATINTCVQSTGLPTGGTHNRNTATSPPSATVYRLSVRVSTLKGNQTFLQTTFTVPD